MAHKALICDIIQEMSWKVMTICTPSHNITLICCCSFPLVPFVSTPSIFYFCLFREPTKWQMYILGKLCCYFLCVPCQQQKPSSFSFQTEPEDTKAAEAHSWSLSVQTKDEGTGASVCPLWTLPGTKTGGNLCKHRERTTSLLTLCLIVLSL